MGLGRSSPAGATPVPLILARRADAGERRATRSPRRCPFAVDVATGTEAAPGDQGPGARLLRRVRSRRPRPLPDALASRPSRQDARRRPRRPHDAVEHRFGPYGGQYVPETLMPALAELEQAWVAARADAGFRAELDEPAARLRRPPVAALPRAPPLRGGRPRRLPQARGPQPHRRAQDQQRARPGAAGQADGQAAHHRRDRRGPARRRDARPPARCSASSASSTWAPRTSAARSPTSSAWSCSARRSRPSRPARARSRRRSARRSATGSPTSPTPTTSSARPSARRRSRRSCATCSACIGDEARAQILEREGRLPDRVIACVGGGSNAIGIFAAVRRRRRGRADRRRGRRRGHRHRPPRRAADRRRPRRRAARLLLGDHAGRRGPDPRGALDLAPASTTRARAPSTPGCATRAAPATSRSPTRTRSPPSAGSAQLEGIIPALESAHAIAWVLANPDPTRGRARPDLPVAAAATRTSPRSSRGRAVSTGAERDRRRVRRRARGPRGADAVPDGRLPRPRRRRGAIGEAYADGGADLVELGVPFSDPLADGPVIHAAGTRGAARRAPRVDGVLDVARALARARPGRAHVLRQPRAAPAGVGALRARDSPTRGVSGLIVPDLPLEEAPAVLAACDAAGVALVPLVAPTTPDERLARDRRPRPRLPLHRLGHRDDRRAQRTGTRLAARDRPRQGAAPTCRWRSASASRRPRDARAAAAAGADGVIVGTRLVRAAAEARDDPGRGRPRSSGRCPRALAG